MILEFDKIKEKLCEEAMSQEAAEKLGALCPYMSQREARLKMNETTEARTILDSMGNPPMSAMKEIGKVISLCAKGSMLLPQQLEGVAVFAASCKRLKAYMKKAEALDTQVAAYGNSICDLSELQEEIIGAVSSDTVLSTASKALRTIRLNMEKEGAQIQRKLADLLSAKKNHFSERTITLRNGRYVVPVKREYKNQFSGTVIDISGSGGTYFMEPSSVAQLQDKINLLRLDEENEVRRILYELTALVDEAIPQIQLNMEAMVTIDVIFAKAKLSASMKGVAAQLNTDREIRISQGRHPLLGVEECVPLDFQMGGQIRGVVITGPNTGGKTVALKTVGLLSMMAQSGLHIPVKEANIAMNNMILCDIGDGQSITENLSTFSSHITNVIGILDKANEESLILLDELGSGTDPAEGMGIAISILEELRRRGCLFVATTHYPEVKGYADKAEGLINARMAFDRESLKPLYRLEIGEAGESCALYIAKRLGFPAHMLKRAQTAAYEQGTILKDKPQADLEDLPEEWRESEVMPARNNGDQHIEKEAERKPLRKTLPEGAAFRRGDCVTVLPEKQVAIVFAPADERGMVGIQIKKEKSYVNHKRLHLKVAAEELYPEDYDLSIVFDDVQTRKLRHQMERKFTKGLQIPVKAPGDLDK